MKLVVNGRFYSRPVTGVERYGFEICQALGKRVRIISNGKFASGVSGQLWEQFFLPSSLQSGELLWSPANTGPISVSNQILTIHDITPLEHPEWYQPVFAMWYRFLIPRLVSRVRYVATPSRYIYDQVARIFSLPRDKVFIINGGVNSAMFNPSSRQTPGWLPENYILYVGSLQPRKNIGALLRAWDLIKGKFPDVHLLIVGMRGKPFRQVALPRSRERVIFSGYVQDQYLPGIYSRAIMLVIPSFEEGFGLTVLEAMSCGTPVIASQGGALPEILEGNGLLFEPSDYLTLADHLTRCLIDRELCAHLGKMGRLHALQYSWQASAERLWEFFRNVH